MVFAKGCEFLLVSLGEGFGVGLRWVLGGGLGADFWEVDLDSNFSIFGVRRFTEWPGILH